MPNTGSNQVTLRFLDGAADDVGPSARLQVADHDLRIQNAPGASDHLVTLPQLPEGRYPLTVDGKETTAILEVYASQMVVEFIDVGQGDATLLIGPGGLTALVDTGPPGSGVRVLEHLSKHRLNRLDMVILTHTDADHIGGLAEFMRGPDGLLGSADDIAVTTVYEDGSLRERQTQIAREVNAWIDENSRRVVPVPGFKVDGAGGFSIEFVAVGGATKARAASDEAQTHSNARSIVNRVCLDDWCGLLTGDITGGGLGTPDVETALSQELTPMIWVKVPHHGSRSSSTSALVQTLQPRLAVYTLGDDNDHCHPAPETLSRWGQTAILLSTGSGQSGQGGCEATIWPAGSQPNCGSITLRKGPETWADLSCGDQTQKL